MPERQTLQRARRDKHQGKAPPTQAGEFVREEFHHIREGKHGARSPQQAIAIGLSKARRAGVELEPPAAGDASENTVRRAARDYARGHGAANPRRCGNPSCEYIRYIRMKGYRIYTGSCVMCCSCSAAAVPCRSAGAVGS